MRASDVGGQAVIEGVMMRSPKTSAVAVRRYDGEIIVKKDDVGSIREKYKFLKFPIIRGVVALVETLVLGIKSLSFSANVAMEEEGSKEQISPVAMFLTIAFAFGMAMLFFVFLPLGITQILKRPLTFIGESSLSFNLVDGLLRIAFFLAYIWGISMLKDIRRIFEYHGAEHKTIYAYENGEELTVENARKYSTLHPRCGTSFLLMVMVISILVFSLVKGSAPFWMKLASRIVLVPLIAGLSFELLKFTARKVDVPIVRVLITPGLWLQKLTTRQPSDDQLEVAIRALKEVLGLADASERETAAENQGTAKVGAL
jgi:uncharacterized protein YqhQ